jgi:transposase
MSGKGKVAASEKVKAVKNVLQAKTNINEEATRLGVNWNTVKNWIVIYQTKGIMGFMEHSPYNKYSMAFKLAAVQDYRNDEGSLRKISDKYVLSNTRMLYNWIKKYNTQEYLSSCEDGGENLLSTAKKTTFEERKKIVRYCLSHDRNYKETAEKFGCSYQQVHNWVKKYDLMGNAGLEDRRGKRAGTLPPRTKEEKQRDEIARLKRENQELRMERDYLKKLKELETTDPSLWFKI